LRLLVIDNYDSFTYNLVHFLGELGASPTVYRNDSITLDDIAAMRPGSIVLSPGPCTPNEAGICLALIDRFKAETPILGVCLGHQAIGQALGGEVVRAPDLMHGKTSPIRHTGKGLFRGLNSGFVATRYHSLIVRRETLPPALEITADTADGLIMGIQHRELPLHGV
jgi:anthranilate synthase component II